jgi:hypothetical protein
MSPLSKSYFSLNQPLKGAILPIHIYAFLARAVLISLSGLTMDSVTLSHADQSGMVMQSNSSPGCMTSVRVKVDRFNEWLLAMIVPRSVRDDVRIPLLGPPDFREISSNIWKPSLIIIDTFSSNPTLLISDEKFIGIASCTFNFPAALLGAQVERPHRSTLSASRPASVMR